jgi:4-amino-4-deoxy-L-arabinose transferase-like glycosyltransferase
MIRAFPQIMQGFEFVVSSIVSQFGILILGMWLKNLPVFLFLIVILGAILRFTSLSQIPPSLNWDEISHGYNAYSILKTGHDEWGQFFPVSNFRAYGDYPLALNLYLTIPFISILGLTQTAIRLPHAILGTLTIIAVYFLAEGITKSKKVGLIAAFLAAIDPWLLFPSRAVFQSNLSVFFLTSAMAVFVNREKNKWLMPISFLFLGLTLFSYHSTRIFSPLLLIVMIFFYWKEIKRSYISIFFILLFFIPLPFILLNPASRARSNVVFIVDQGAINKIENLRATSTSPFKKLLYNKVTYFGEKFIGNYVNYFSPRFLFLEGGTQYQFSVPNHGLLYLVNLPLFYLGLVFVFLQATKYKNKTFRLLLFWLILAPIPAAITQDSSAVIRATTMLPIPEILISIGIYQVMKLVPKYEILFSVVFVFAMFFSLENYLSIYIKSYRTNYSWSWQYGYEQIVDYAKTNYSKYDQIIVTKAYGEPHEYFLFFMKYNPAKYMSDKNKITFYQSNWYWVDHFDKFWFVNDWQMKDLITESKHVINCKNQKCLLVTTPNNAPKDWQKISEVKFLDGKIAFEMYEN